MGKKKQKSKIQSPVKPSPGRNLTTYNYTGFKNKHAGKVMVACIVLLLLFIISLFKNISHPLFWADESMTAIGTERVLQYGYPKVHDGKNVFYDLRHSNPALGIRENNDAYVGGTGWGHYYYGVIGYKLAGLSDDIYNKTGIYRATYAIAGLFGFCLLGFFISKMFADRFSKYTFGSLYLLSGLMSVSLALLIREVRYYSLVILLVSVILGLYAVYRFHRPVNRVLFIAIITLSLWLLFNTFAPVYFIMLATLGVSEMVIFGTQLQKKDFKSLLRAAMPVILSLVISLVAVLPLLSYFRTFEISKAMNEFNQFTNEKYWKNVSTVFKYFKEFELLWLAMMLKVLVVIFADKLFRERTALFRVSVFLTLFFVIYLFTIASIPNFIYTRYIIYLQPVLAIIIILDFFMLMKLFSMSSNRLVSVKMLGLAGIFLILFLYTFVKNFGHIKGHIYELTHMYKGPLDYTIPYIQEKFPETHDLVIAANYEETSYMYYLKSKVIIGYTGNNLREDSIVQPDIITYRKTWGNYPTVFQQYLRKEPYEAVKFSVKDNPVNNIPELNFIPAFNHQFRTLMAKDDSEAAFLYVKK